MISASVGIDHKVGRKVGLRRLEQDMDTFGSTGAAFGAADHPTHSVTRGDGPGSNKLLAAFQAHVRYFTRRGIHLIEGAIRKGIDLDGVDIVRAGRLDP